jgi:copper chaperone CopZ
MSYYIHNVPGRLRIKIPLIRRNLSKCIAIRDLLVHLDGVERIKVTELTGSVVINYDPQIIQPQDIFQILKDNDYFDESQAISHDAHIQTAASKAGMQIGRAVFGWAVGKALEGSGLSALAILI